MAIEGRFIRSRNTDSKILIDSGVISRASLKDALNITKNHVKRITSCKSFSLPWRKHIKKINTIQSELDALTVIFTKNKDAAYAKIGTREILIPLEWIKQCKSADSIVTLLHEFGHIAINDWAPGFGRKSRNVFNSWRLESKRSSSSNNGLSRYLSRASVAAKGSKRIGSRWTCKTPSYEKNAYKNPNHPAWCEFIVESFAIAATFLITRRITLKAKNVLRDYPESWSKIVPLITKTARNRSDLLNLTKIRRKSTGSVRNT